MRQVDSSTIFRQNNCMQKRKTPPKLEPATKAVIIIFAVLFLFVVGYIGVATIRLTPHSLPGQVPNLPAGATSQQ